MMNEEENKGSTNKSKALHGLKRLISDLLFSVDNKNKDNGKVEKKVSVHKAITGNKRYGTDVSNVSLNNHIRPVLLVIFYTTVLRLEGKSPIIA